MTSGNHTNRGEILCTIHDHIRSLGLAKNAESHGGSNENVPPVPITASVMKRAHIERQVQLSSSRKAELRKDQTEVRHGLALHFPTTIALVFILLSLFSARHG